MNKNGSVLIYGMMMAMVVVLLALALAPALFQMNNAVQTNSTDDFTNGGGTFVGLDCSNSSISNFQRAGCYATDLGLFYFVGSLIFIAGGIIGARIVFGGLE